MNNFLDFVNTAASKVAQNNDEQREPEPKGGYLVIPKDTKEVKVRILPSIEFIKGETNNPMTFAEENLRIFFSTKHQTNAGNFARVNWNVKDDQETLALVKKWAQEGKMESQYGTSRPRPEFLMNVLQLDADNNPVGQPMVYRAPKTVYSQLLGLLQDKDSWSEGSQMGWLDPNYGNAIKIKKNEDNSYTVRAANRALPPIDLNAVAPYLEPLSTFTQPSRLTSPDYYAQVVEWKNEEQGALATPAANPYTQEATNAPFAQPAQPNFGAPVQQQAPAQPVFTQPTQPAFGTPTQQAPAQPNFGAPAQSQAPAQPAFSAPAQPDFGAPTPQEAPAQQQAPAQSAPSTGDASLDEELSNILGM